MTIHISRPLLLALLFSLMAACGNNDTATKTPETPVAILDADECHLCGMAMKTFPGPKGEAYEKMGFGGQQSEVRKFCSTRDLFSWYLQPENIDNTNTIYVHDMARSDWNKPDDEHMIDGRKAWYVNGSNQMGAMGPTLAAFSQQSDAEFFAKQYGGRILRFEDITMDELNRPYGEQMHSGMGNQSTEDHSMMNHDGMDHSNMSPPAMPAGHNHAGH